jgi:hypothetical protein
MAKLTLNIEPDQIERVKRYALRHHTSVSKLFSEIINKITENEEKLEDNVLLEKYKNIEVPEWIKELTGIVKLPEGTTYDDVRYSYLKDKYGL